MSQRTTSIDDPDLSELLDGIDAGKVALPNFQRDFDWSDSDVRALLATVLNGWPMGSLLLIEGDQDSQGFYNPRQFEFAPPLAGTPELIVLDGQQRLTSLYTAFYDRSESVFAVSFENELNWTNIDSVDDAIRTFKRSAWNSHYHDAASQVRACLLPVSALRTSSQFFDWRDAAGNEDQRTLENLTNIYREHLAGLYRYRMPALLISKATPPAAVARIFERVNKTGQQLGTFDLMVAKSFTPTFNLRVAWQEALETFPILERFYGNDGLAPLQVITLRVREDVRTSSVLKLTPNSIHDSWNRAVECLSIAVNLAINQLGVLSKDWLPYNSLIVVLASHAWSTTLDEEEILAVKRWFWQSCLTSRYAVGSNTVAVADFRRLGNGYYRNPSPIQLDWTVFRDATKQSAGAVHRAWLCALAATSGQWANGVESSLPVPRSLINREVRIDGEISPHLLTLGFVLSSDEGNFDEQFLLADKLANWTSYLGDRERTALMRERLQLAATFFEQECDQQVTVFDGTEEDIHGRGD